MLDEVNTDTDRAQENLDIITKKTRELVKQAGVSYFTIFACLTNLQTVGGMKNLCIIIVLSLILVILTYLVIMS